MEESFMSMAEQLTDEQLIDLYGLLCDLQHKPLPTSSNPTEAEKT